MTKAVGTSRSSVVFTVSHLQGISLRVHVPKQYILGPQSAQIGTTLRPEYIYLDTWNP